MKTYKYRIKDSTTQKKLTFLAKEVNFVWNVCNEQIRKRWKESRRITTKVELNKITRGASKFLSINQQTIQAVSYELETRTRKNKKFIKFRGKKSLGWIPFNGQTIKICGDLVNYNKCIFKFWKSRDFPSPIKMGSFNQDCRGRWYINFVAEDNENLSCESGEVGIDLGLIHTATDSNGRKLSSRNYRKYEKKLGMAQRARKKKLAKKIHAKIKNKRKDDIEKITTQWAKENKIVVVGNISPKKLIKTKFAKSTLDSSWSLLTTRLSHKTLRYGGIFLEVNEANTSRTCSHCRIHWDFPKGLKSLAIREYKCPGCHVEQDRDINAARNILRIGHDSLNAGKTANEESPTIIALAV